MKMDYPQKKKMIKPSQGVHIILDKKFLNSHHAILIPHTSDGRVLFAVPWNNYAILGTTDTPLNEIKDEPVPLKEEIKFILKNAQTFMKKKPSFKDIKSVFAGLRPLAAESNQKTKEISRHHKISVSKSGLLSILVENGLHIEKLQRMPLTHLYRLEVLVKEMYYRKSSNSWISKILTGRTLYMYMVVMQTIKELKIGKTTFHYLKNFI